MVGHTHDNIDQTFSCLSRYLRKHDAATMPGKYIAFPASPSYSFIVIDHLQSRYDSILFPSVSSMHALLLVVALTNSII